MPKLWRVLLTLGCGIILILLLWRSPPKELSELISQAQQVPDYPTTYLVNARTRQFDEEGKLSYILEADKMAYFNKSDPSKPDTLLEQPNITMFDQDNSRPPWKATANNAEGSEQQDELIMIGDVVIQQRLDNGEQTRLETTELTIKPNRRYAETDKPVIITDKTGVVRSTGVRIFFDDERIELLSNVSGNYTLR
jgi:lipopolysaccharide export system protein LptC